MTTLAAVASSILKYKVTRFAGGTELIDYGDPVPLRFERTATWTIATWLNFTLGHVGVMVGKTGTTDALARGYDLHTLNNGDIGANINNNFAGLNWLGFGTIANGFNDGRWHHVVWTYDGSSTVAGNHIYVDAFDEPLQTFRDTLTATILTAAEFRIGSRDVVPQRLPYTGLLHDVLVYNIEFNQAQVDELYNSRCPPDPLSLSTAGNLIDGWLLGEHKGDTDLTSFATSFPTVPGLNGITGTMTNMTAAAIETRR